MEDKLKTVNKLQGYYNSVHRLSDFWILAKVIELRGDIHKLMSLCY